MKSDMRSGDDVELQRNPLSNNSIVTNEVNDLRITDINHDDDTEHVSAELWSILNIDLKRLILAEESKITIPEGISEKLWEALTEGSKKEILACIRSNQGRLKSTSCWGKRNSSSVYSFFTDFESNDFDFEGAINAMSLICALILTIPFSVADSFDTSFFESLYDQMQSCDTTSTWGKNPKGQYTFYYNKIRDYLGASLYTALNALCFATCYYVFKPRSLISLPKLSKIKLRILLFMIFFCTVLTVIFSFNLFLIMLNSMIIDNNSCGNNESLSETFTGIFIFSNYSPNYNTNY